MVKTLGFDWPDWPGQDLDGVPHIKGLHKAIQVEINGQPIKLLTVGYVAHALRRTPWTIHHWEQLDLFPKAPFYLHPNDARTRRRLYPQPFVDRLNDIYAVGYLGQRLDWYSWKRFYLDVRDAYEETIVPLLRPGVLESEAISTLMRVGGVQASSGGPRIG